MNEIDQPVPDIQIGTLPATDSPEPLTAANAPPEPAPRPVDPVRSAAGRRGGHRAHELAVLGREYEKEHGLTPGREQQKHLIRLGKRYEVEHGLRAAEPRRRKKGDAWQEFVSALVRVVRPAHRAAVEQLAAALRPDPEGVAAEPGADRAA